jgi:hypothetical protein
MKTHKLTIAAIAIALIVSADAAYARGSGGSGGSLGRVHLSHSNSAPYPPKGAAARGGEPSGGHVFTKFSQ